MSKNANDLKKKEQVKKWLVYSAMVIACAVFVWFIFKPSKKQLQTEQQNTGLNTQLPAPRNAGIEADKITAYELDDMRVRQEQKMMTLEDFAAKISYEGQERNIEISEINGTLHKADGRSDMFSTSTSAYNDINATLGSFYERPREDPEKEALKAELEQMKQSTVIAQNLQPTYEEQIALLEKSYELAAKYMPGNSVTTESEEDKDDNTEQSDKPKAVPIGLVSRPVVSSLPQPMNDSVMINRLMRYDRYGFHTAVGGNQKLHDRNTVKACVYGDQTVVSGQSVRLRLLEDMRVGNMVLPCNTIITGKGNIKGERLDISIVQVEYEGVIIPVELNVHDNDGQSGIFIPGSMETSVAKEMAANLGQNLGTSISITTQSAEEQLLSEVGKGTIQGVSQYITKKMREEKVHLKSGYALMLYQNNQ